MIDGAFDLIRQWWPQCRDAALRRTTFLAVAMLRQQPAIQYLLSLIADESIDVVRDAIAALQRKHT